MKKVHYFAIMVLGLSGATERLSPVLAQEAEPEQEAEVEIQPERRARDEVRIGSDFHLPVGKRSKDTTVVLGSAVIDGTVDGDLVVVLGNATVNGKINGELVVVAGSATLGSEADVRNDCVVVAGKLDRDPAARIGGDVVALASGSGLPGFVEPMFAWLKNGPMLARPMAPKVPWSWAVAAIVLAFYCLLALLFRRPLQAGVEAVETRPLGSLMAGFLVFLLIVPVLILLAISVVGTVLVPFLLCGLVFAFFLGKATVYQFVGFQVSGSLRATTALSLLALLIGAVIFLLLYLIPFLGFFVWGLVTIWGIGAVTLACFRSLRRDKPATHAPATVTFNPLQQTVQTANPPVIASVGAAHIGSTDAPLASAPSAAISYALAGFWIRLLAMLLDFILVGGVLAVLRAQKLFLFVWLVYHVGFWIWKSMTIGDIIVGIKCVRTDGQPMNVAASIIRALASVFSAMAFGLGFFWAGWDRQKQSWHDKIAGTYMVKVPKGASLV
jgi:uncharacterized RDD family membrane protein YckC